MTENSAVTTDISKSWKLFLEIVKNNVPALSFNTWFLPIKPLELNDSILKVQVPNSYFIEWIDEHFNTLINQALAQVVGENAKLIYVIYDDFKPENEQPEEDVEIKKISATETQNNFNTHLNPRYKFDNFIKGEGNQLARAAAIAIGENPGETTFNPFFIYGGVGLGKTHLIHSIGNAVLAKNPGKKVIYLSTEHFTVEFVDSIQNDRINEFSNFYKSMDVLIIDDIQFLIGKEKTQDLFFHIFNTLHQAGKQIVLSSDKPPKDLKGLNERLISRFQWGLTADIQPPDFETRIAILKNKSFSYGITLSQDILEYIASNITSNIRELEGCLIKILASSSLSSKEIDMNLVKKIVREVSTTKEIVVSIDYITKIVCAFYSVEENRVREKNRRKEVVMARQVAMYLSKLLTKSSLKTIGLHFGGRDHSTVIHAFNTIEDLVGTDLQTKEAVETIKLKIESGTT